MTGSDGDNGAALREMQLRTASLLLTLGTLVAAPFIALQEVFDPEADYSRVRDLYIVLGVSAIIAGTGFFRAAWHNVRTPAGKPWRVKPRTRVGIWALWVRHVLLGGLIFALINAVAHIVDSNPNTDLSWAVVPGTLAAIVVFPFVVALSWLVQYRAETSTR